MTTTACSLRRNRTRRRAHAAGTRNPYRFEGEPVVGRKAWELHYAPIEHHAADWQGLMKDFPTHDADAAALQPGPQGDGTEIQPSLSIELDAPMTVEEVLALTNKHGLPGATLLHAGHTLQLFNVHFPETDPVQSAEDFLRQARDLAAELHNGGRVKSVQETAVRLTNFGAKQYDGIGEFTEYSRGVSDILQRAPEADIPAAAADQLGQIQQSAEASPTPAPQPDTATPTLQSARAAAETQRGIPAHASLCCSKILKLTYFSFLGGGDVEVFLAAIAEKTFRSGTICEQMHFLGSAC